MAGIHTIQQAARWAQAQGLLTRVDHKGEPQDLYAVYSTGTHLVEKTGEYEECRGYMRDLCGTHCFMHHAKTTDGRYLAMRALSTICEEMDESEGEARCLPEPGEMREWG